jgi:site-specific recombinase XerD
MAFLPPAFAMWRHAYLTASAGRPSVRDAPGRRLPTLVVAFQAWLSTISTLDNDLVFSSSVGTPLDTANVRHSFRRITKAAGLGTNGTPRELRHSFVSIMSDNGATLEQVADLVICQLDMTLAGRWIKTCRRSLMTVDAGVTGRL